MAPFRSIRHKNWQTCRMMREREGDDDADGGGVSEKVISYRIRKSKTIIHTYRGRIRDRGQESI